MSSRIELGRAGEERARQHLQSQGWQILCSNWRCRQGEIDLVARLGRLVAFIEVKTRQGAFAGESVTAAKQRKLRSLAVRYLAEHPHGGEIRFDVIVIEGNELLHLEAAF